MSLSPVVIDHGRYFEDHKDAPAIAAMLDAVREAMNISRAAYLGAHLGELDAREFLGAEHKTVGYADYEDLVTVTDRQCEEAMMPILSAARDIPFLAEETANHMDDTKLPDGTQRWLIDPIDGTFCFVNGHDDFSVTLALQTKVDGKWETNIGIVGCPMHDEIYLADDRDAYLIQGMRAKKLQVPTVEPEGLGSYSLREVLNGKRIETVVYIKDESKPGWQNIEHRMVERLGDSAQSTYSTANMVAKIADGWVDGAILGSNALEYAWDTDAAIHIAKKAGAHVLETEIDGEPFVFLANSKPLLRALETAARQELNQSLAQQKSASR